MISIITPVYNEEENINCFYDAVTAVMKQVGMDYELIYVNDGSRDGTEKEISRLAAADPHVRAVSLARNFGHQIALTCGMDLSIGDAIITLDGDMQHPPALIPALIARWQEGYDIVQTVRETTENASLFKRVTSAAYYKLMNAISVTPVVPGGSDFRLMDRKALSVFRRFREHSRFIRGIVGGLGFRQTTLSFKAPARHAGTSKFSLRKMLHSGYGRHHYQLDGTASSDLLYRIPGSLCRAADDYICLLLSHCGHYRAGLVHDSDSPGNLRQYQPHGSGHIRRIHRPYF